MRRAALSLSFSLSHFGLPTDLTTDHGCWPPLGPRAPAGWCPPRQSARTHARTQGNRLLSPIDCLIVDEFQPDGNLPEVEASGVVTRLCCRHFRHRYLRSRLGIWVGIYIYGFSVGCGRFAGL
ncbi:uncharacterized protein K452DRAFT_284775 [Aplosporella prunicola CBS 121167]|uniref:Uncharacterized protein n=1 Tax=Aplosporella prunicola CBS 121167 TaxID=1176127 RepID=A0A6A6BK92_9PEZI|nr:uncharacterized protein K452DRAFT_284775 [Aplosporella prunicola CBS 121167]KAF2144456.1 hypothetical protein K452DRAFT_284775 [Aplosporella prunicola CBS 121167]